jgi:hypothetical protein
MTARHATSKANFLSTDISLSLQNAHERALHAAGNAKKVAKIPSTDCNAGVGVRFARTQKKPEAAAAASGFLDYPVFVPFVPLRALRF